MSKMGNQRQRPTSLSGSLLKILMRLDFFHVPLSLLAELSYNLRFLLFSHSTTVSCFTSDKTVLRAEIQIYEFINNDTYLIQCDDTIKKTFI